MNTTMISFGLIGVFLLLGLFLRGKVSILGKWMIPSSVIAGIVGFVFMNLPVTVPIDAELLSEIVNQLFVISFISIGLTPTAKGVKAGSTVKHAYGMGMIWCFLYACTPLIGALIAWLLQPLFDMDAMYGTLIPFGFAQGPGQAVTFGMLYESYGWKDATNVGLTFAVTGFVFAFLIGIPIAKKIILLRNSEGGSEIDSTLYKGYYKDGEQPEIAIKESTFSSNIEMLAFHFALIGACYIVACGICKLVSYLPGFLGSSLSGMFFMNGLLAAYLVRFIMNKLHITYLIDTTIQQKITGWTTDFLVVAAFMAVKLSVLSSWIIPILVIGTICAVITVAVCLFYEKSSRDEDSDLRLLGIYGTSTGTIPSGIALIRIVDPMLSSPSAMELGILNIFMMPSFPVYLILLAAASGTISFSLTLIILAALSVIYLGLYLVSTKKKQCKSEDK